MSDIDDSNASSQDAPLKRCPKCGETKPRIEFGKNKTKRDGLGSYCKQCRAKYRIENTDKERERNARYYRENADKLREDHAFYYRENADKFRENHARYYRDNAEKLHKYNAAYRIENPDKIREIQARYLRANPDKARAKDHRRRARKNNLLVQWTDADIHRMLEHWKNCCAVCGQGVEPNNVFYVLAHDHWIPLTSPECLGTVPWNMLPLCHSRIGNAMGCNLSKSNKDPIEWLNSRYSPEQVRAILKRIDKYFASVKR